VPAFSRWLSLFTILMMSLSLQCLFYQSHDSMVLYAVSSRIFVVLRAWACIIEWEMGPASSSKGKTSLPGTSKTHCCVHYWTICNIMYRLFTFILWIYKPPDIT
jgi:hypothetical protein